jgi:hypothetical protein
MQALSLAGSDARPHALLCTARTNRPGGWPVLGGGGQTAFQMAQVETRTIWTSDTLAIWTSEALARGYGKIESAHVPK